MSDCSREKVRQDRRTGRSRVPVEKRRRSGRKDRVAETSIAVPKPSRSQWSGGKRGALRVRTHVFTVPKGASPADRAGGDLSLRSEPAGDGGKGRYRSWNIWHT